MSKEHGILFKPEMIQAILDGRKTMTRRVVKPQPEAYEVDGMKMYRYTDRKRFMQGELSEISEPFIGLGDVKYSIGDLLYVKEAVSKIPDGGDSFGEWLYKRREDKPYGKWISPLFMPKAAASIWLEITDIKVERLHDITDGDVAKEGVEWNEPFTMEKKEGRSPAQRAFKKLWQKINSSESWHNNPFVWVISFKKIDKN